MPPSPELSAPQRDLRPQTNRHRHQALVQSRKVHARRRPLSQRQSRGPDASPLNGWFGCWHAGMRRRSRPSNDKKQSSIFGPENARKKEQQKVPQNGNDGTS